MSPESTGEVTLLLRRLNGGERAAESQLFEILYPLLRRLAESYMRGERADHMLQPTALVNEAYVKLFGGKRPVYEDRKHFYVLTARAMKRVLIDYAKKRRAVKGPGGWERCDVDSKPIIDVRVLDLELLIDVEAAMDELNCVDARACQVASLRHYLGMTIEEAAQALGVSPRTVKRDWEWARAFLGSRVQGGRRLRAEATG